MIEFNDRMFIKSICSGLFNKTLLKVEVGYAKFLKIKYKNEIKGEMKVKGDFK